MHPFLVSFVSTTFTTLVSLFLFCEYGISWEKEDEWVTVGHIWNALFGLRHQRKRGGEEVVGGVIYFRKYGLSRCQKGWNVFCDKEKWGERVGFVSRSDCDRRLLVINLECVGFPRRSLISSFMTQS